MADLKDNVKRQYPAPVKLVYQGPQVNRVPALRQSWLDKLQRAAEQPGMADYNDSPAVEKEKHQALLVKSHQLKEKPREVTKETKNSKASVRMKLAETNDLLNSVLTTLTVQRLDDLKRIDDLQTMVIKLLAHDDDLEKRLKCAEQQIGAMVKTIHKCAEEKKALLAKNLA